jgi:hypothetical protein
MTEYEAARDLHSRGIFQLAPGLWCDKSVPDMIAVADEHDTAIGVRRALEKAGSLPPVQNEG